MKKTVSVVLAMIFLLFSVSIIGSAETVTDMATGISNVRFSDGYTGFCIDSKLHGAANGDTFTSSANTSAATSNYNGADISKQLKILFVVCFDDIFTLNGSGEYYIEKDLADGALQMAIYHFSDNYWPSGLQKTFVDKVKAYDGAPIPDDGYTIERDGKTITFSFKVLEPEAEDQQTFFALKVTADDGSAHVHSPSTDWKSDGDNHWHECSCGEKSDLTNHEGTTADCENGSVCEICEKVLGDVNPDNHTGETYVKDDKPASEFETGYTGDTYCGGCDKLIKKGETVPATHKHSPSTDWKSDGNNHWHECSCGEKSDVAKHSITDGICITCGMEFKDEEKEPDSSIDLDGILGALPEIDLDGILGMIPGFGSDNDKNDSNTSAPETDTEIPDTGSSSDIAYVFGMLLMSSISFAFVTNRRKKEISDK